MSCYFRLQSLSYEVAYLSSKAKSAERQKTIFHLIEKQNALSSSNYMSQVMEIPLLEKERETLTRLTAPFPNTAPLYNRLLFLQSGQNRIRFDGGRIHMDDADLRNFLEAVEGARYNMAEGKPFLLIKKFDLIKCTKENGEAVYSVQVELQ